MNRARVWLFAAAFAPAFSIAADRAATAISDPNASVAEPAPIALVLPLASATYGRAAEAVKSGYLAAARAAGSEAKTRIFSHGDDGVLPAIAAAHDAGASLIVGPLTRDDVKTAFAFDLTRSRLLALNQPDDGAPLPDNVYVLTLAIDSEAAQLARFAYADGARNIVAVSSNSALQQRFRNAFDSAWQRAGGTPVFDYYFDAAPDMLALLRKELTSNMPDAIVLAVDGPDAALVKSFLPQTTVYASSQIADDQAPSTLRDLENVRYVEIPWLADAGNPSWARLPRGNFSSQVLERLYALGIDAFAVAQMLAETIPPDHIELDGATGHLSLTSSRAFAREGQIVVFRDGRVTRYEPPR